MCLICDTTNKAWVSEWNSDSRDNGGNNLNLIVLIDLLIMLSQWEEFFLRNFYDFLKIFLNLRLDCRYLD